MNARESHRNRRISTEQEKRAAADLGGRTQAASGATRLGGGADVRVQGVYRVECKVTEKSSYSLKRADLEKLWKQATQTLEMPVFQIAFKNRFGRLDIYAILVSVLPFKEGSNPFHMDTYNKSITLPRNFLQSSLAEDRILLTFRTPSYVHQWEIMTWGQFLEITHA